MKKKIICFSICMLLLVSYAGAVSSPSVELKTYVKSTSDVDYSHSILGEFFTLTTCVPCKYSHRALKNLYNGEYHPFYYISMIYDNEIGNKWADQRHDELDVTASPTVMWDGPFKKDVGSNEDIEEDMADYNISIISCGNRNVKDIDLNLNVEWLGAVNIDPPDGETGVPIGQVMSWTNSEMEIDMEVTNHETSQYNGHLHVYVTEVNSTMWNDKWGDPYTFAFLDYAWNEDVTISSNGGTWDDTVIWDGYDHETGYGECYQNITQDNIMVIASIFDEDNNDYADETTGIQTGYDTDPKLYDIYFGATFPLPLIAENVTWRSWYPHDGLNFSTTYCWRIDVKDANGNVISGDFSCFTTRGNDPPNDPGWEYPINGSIDVPIMVNLSFVCEDPDGDDVTYDIYFGDDPENMQQIAWNQTEDWFVIEDLDFLKTYYWYVVAWDEYGAYTIGPLWSFTTEANLPPCPAIVTNPPDGDPAVPIEGVILEWDGCDPNIGDTLRFDVYFDDVNPPLAKRVSEGYDEYWEVPFTLSKYKTYWWRVDTYDKMDEFAEGNVWSFSTEINHPPSAPIIKIEKIVMMPIPAPITRTFNFTFMATDPDGHDVYYWIDWDDGSYEGWIGPYPSGEEITRNHTWNQMGEYNIRAKAKDIYGAEGPWGTLPFPISISQSVNQQMSQRFTNPLILRFLEQFPLLQKLLLFIK